MHVGWRFVICFLSIFIPSILLLGGGLILAFNGGGVWLLGVGFATQVSMPLWAPPYLRKVDSWL